jgi:hypothetical protein
MVVGCTTTCAIRAYHHSSRELGERRGRDRMVDGFTSTYAISDYHH